MKNNCKNLFIIISTILIVQQNLLFAFNLKLQEKVPNEYTNTIKLKDIHIRDPYILPDKQNGLYYLYRSASTKDKNGQELGGVEIFWGSDLKEWSGPKRVFTVQQDNWITGTIWAPEIHFYKGKYYLFGTVNTQETWRESKPDWPAFTYRGTQVFHANSPEGPFLPFGLYPHTPIDFMALDGTLWEEDGKPYMIYCHEWVQVVDGTIEMIELKPDLSEAIGMPEFLFRASDAPWTPDKANSYVTDGCYLYRTKTGKLLMIWSSFLQNGNYAIGIAESTTGKLLGPWIHHSEPLVNENGGHGSIFSTFEEKLCLILHQPNSPNGQERAQIFELEDKGDNLVIKGNLIMD